MRTVVASESIRTLPEHCLDAFTEFEMLKDWWGVEKSLVEKKSGGLYVLCWGVTDTTFSYATTGIISFYEPGHLLQIGNYIYLNPEISVLGPMSLKIEVKKAGEETKIKITQDGYGEGNDWDWYYEAVKRAWPDVLTTLKNYLERPPSMKVVK